ncbi:MAG: hypothetical protein EON90_05915 [Brevundimonas sp.]|nr:MAG: hypothetical protein EON90_05915 [Brevundimonas sp.]
MLSVSGLAVVTAISFSSGPVAPQERIEALSRVTACRAIADGAARLSCYDAAVSALDSAERQGEVVVVDRAQIGEVRRQLFGFQMPAVPNLFGGDPAAQIDSIETTLQSATEIGRNRWVFRLADGGVWRQVDTDPFRGQPRPGDAVRVRKASLGSFLMTVGGSRAVRVRRE